MDDGTPRDPGPAGDRPAPRTPTRIDRIAEAHVDATAALDPVWATYAGLSGHDDRLTDYSPAGHTARAEAARHTLRALAGLEPADDVDRVTITAMRERLGLELEQHAAGLPLADLNNISSPVQTLREVFDVAPTATVTDWENVAARLAGMGAAVAGYQQSLAQARRDGWRPPARQVTVAAGQAEEFAAEEGFFAGLAGGAGPADGSGLPDPVRERLADAARGAARAYHDLARWLRTELLPGARADDAAGRDAYPLHARGFLGTAVDIDDTYAWGLAELERIERRMAEVAADITGEARDGDGTPSAVAAAIAAGIETLDADPTRRIEGAEAFRDWMQRLSESAIETLAGTHFDIAPPLRRLVCRIAPSTSGAVYYTAPSEDFSRPGQMWWSVPAGTTAFSTWRETSTVYHEGVPGHHLQVGRAVYLHDRLNRWRRVACWVSGHGEGWALYAERLMEELGHLDDPGVLMGMLDAQALRAARVVVDLGVHARMPAPAEVGGGIWDADKAWAFLRAHTRVPDPQLRFELDRYLGWPGQAISYKVGERVWLDLRERVRARAGAAFDLRDFHGRALDLGSVGLDVLTDAVLTDAVLTDAVRTDAAQAGATPSGPAHGEENR